MSRNVNLHRAKKEKNDEFYTGLSDIEKELIHYKDHFKGKVVYCNCDGPDSNFVKYFTDNFEQLGLKKLIVSGYTLKDNNVDIDFRSKEAITLLKEADIVVTNPPFSLFREYVKQLVEHDKKFLIIGNNNAIICKEIFHLVKDNKIWLGYNSNKTMEFQLADDYKKWNRIENGKKYGKVPAISWFTNLDISKRHEDLILYKTYNSNDFPIYDNYNAINVDKVKDIPNDYDGIMGVPITFMNKYSPDQFDIIGIANGNTRTSTSQEILKSLNYRIHPNDKGGCGIINGKIKYPRILIKKVTKEVTK